MLGLLHIFHAKRLHFCLLVNNCQLSLNPLNRHDISQKTQTRLISYSTSSSVVSTTDDVGLVKMGLVRVVL